MGSRDRIASLAEVPTDSTFVFRVRDADETREAIVVRNEQKETELTAWLNYCQHLTHVKLDKGSGAELRDDELVCTNHGAYFESDTGRCTFGPCEGAYLESVDVTAEDGAVLLTDDDYEFVGVGPLADDDDLSSTSNVEF